MSEKPISEARASVMLYSYEKEEWEDSGDAWVQVYHHLVNNTYRIVGRKFKDESVVINFTLVKGLLYETRPTFHQWSDQSQVYGLSFASKHDAQVFRDKVLTALENLKTSDEACSSSASEGGITNKAYLPNKGEKKEENEEGNGKGQEGTGLAFSGGGIRSAAVCSGVLRELLGSGVEVDYLSCVSGGGYTGTAYLDWKYHEERKARSKKRDWHKKFFGNMTQRSGYICDWTKWWKGILDTIVLIGLLTLVLVVQPVVKWGAYACPVAFIIDLLFGKFMRRSADCDVALERQKEMNESSVPNIDFINRCLSGNHNFDITLTFVILVFLFLASYTIPKCTEVNRFWRAFFLLCEYLSGGLLMFTFIPFAVYDFIANLPWWTQLFVGIIVMIVWVAIPVLRRKTSYFLIIYTYSYVVYWKVFKIPVVYINYEDDLFHWLLCASGLVLLISPFTTALQERLVHVYNRWRLQKAFYHEKSTGRCGCSGIGLRHICPLWLCCCSCGSQNAASDTEVRPLTLADLKDMKPQYLSNIVVNRWKRSEGDRLNYALLTMSPTDIERFDQHGENQFEGKLEPGDIMLSDAMATSAAALSNHMGKYEGSIEGLKRLHTILGLEMGATVTGDTKYAKQGWKKKILPCLLHFIRGAPLITPTVFQLIMPSNIELVIIISMGAFVLLHVVLAFIAGIDTGAEEPKWFEKIARWFIAHNSFVYNARLLFSKDNIGPTPPAVLLLSDGGHYQNLAILPLLQRKLKRIVVVDGGYKHEEEAYGEDILDALMLARAELNCSFYGEDGKDVITDLMQMFVRPEREGKPRYYKFKVHYDNDNDNDPERTGEIILLVPRKQEKNKDLTGCCCECCHRKSCLCACLSSNDQFPQHHTGNQFFTPRMFSAYHEEGRLACKEAKADEFLKAVCSVVDVTDSSEEPNRPAFQPPRGAGRSKYNEIPLHERSRQK